ncbi:MAG: aspartate/glutamate racemase family protein [Defluviitaleaceae bacterium]|nr:aspartate/glutamate racemase family protein [Defluviitaleaceae bacterium]
MQKIGIFDSGVGGLTFYKELKKVANVGVVYFGDNARAPYGSKSKEVLQSYAEEIMAFLEKKGCDTYVCACNSLASNVVFDREVIELISYGAEDALEKTKTGKIGLLATEATVKSGAFEKYIENLQSVTCPKFVPLIENGETDIDDVAYEYVNKLNDVDTIILGCTHYPLIKDTISKFTTADLIDPAVKTAEIFKNVKQVTPCLDGNDEFYVSGDTLKFEAFFEKVFGYEIKAKQILDICPQIG